MIVTTEKQLESLVDSYGAFPAFAFDTETRGENPLDPRRNEVFWISLAGPGRADVIPIGHRYGRLLEPARKEKEAWYDEVNRTKTGKPRKKWRTITIPAVWSDPPQQLRPSKVWSALRPLFFSGKTIIGHNIKFDIENTVQYFGEIPTGPFVDCGIMQHLINENIGDKGLEALVKKYFGFSYEQLGKMVDSSPFYAVARYSRLDAKYTWLLWKKLTKFLKAQKLEHLLDLDTEMLEAVIHAETKGVLINKQQIDELERDLSAEIAEKVQELYDEAGKEWNLNSNKQKAWFIYEHCDNPVLRTTDTGNPSTDETAIEHLKKKDPRIATLARFTELDKLRGTFVAAFRDKHMIPSTGRIHTNYRLDIAVTGRLSSKQPNLQNIPIHGQNEYAPKIRGMFIADPGYKLVVADYSQIEYRVLAHISGDPTYRKMFLDDEIDPHILTATLLFGTAMEDVTKTDRTVAKNTGFAVVYGARPDKVAGMSNVTLDRAKFVMNKHQKTFPRVYSWIDETIREARQLKPPHTKTMMGRKRRLPDLISRDKGIRGRAERQAINHIIQGSAGELNKKACVRYYQSAPPEMPLILTVHDELVILTPEDRTDECVGLVTEAMIGDGIQDFLNVPILVDIHVVDKWSQAK